MINKLEIIVQSLNEILSLPQQEGDFIIDKLKEIYTSEELHEISGFFHQLSLETNKSVIVRLITSRIKKE